MTTSKLIAIALAALLVFAGGAAALPGQASNADAADEHQPEDPGADASDANGSDGDDGAVADDVTANGTDADETGDENASDGPPTEMPDDAPDHVTELHQLIRDKLDGNLTGQELGEAISGLLGSGDDAQANSQADAAGEQSENADATASESSDQAEHANAGVAGDLPEQADDHVSGIHDAISSFLNGDGNLGDEVGASAG